MSDRSDEIARRSSNERFRRRRAELIDEMIALVGARDTPQPMSDPDRAASIAAEMVRAYRDAEAQGWAIVRREWRTDERGAVSDLLQAVGATIKRREIWLVLPGREPHVIVTTADVVLDNPLGFVTLADSELTLFDQSVPGGLTITRHAHVRGAETTHSWEIEAWGSEPWLSAATRAIREQRWREGTV